MSVEVSENLEPSNNNSPVGVLQGWLGEYEKASTRFGYASALYSFLSIIYKYNRQKKRVSDADKQHFEMLARQYLSEDRNYTNDIITFAKTCDKPTKTIKMYVSVVREFLKTNSIRKITIDDTDLKKIRTKIPKRYEVSTEKELTIDVIRTILQHADIRIKSLCLVLLSSGLRLSEALSIRISDFEEIEDGFGKLKLTYQHAKTGREIYTLITPETFRAVNEWLKVREKYISEKCIAGELKKDDDRIFPFTKNVATIAFHNILERSGLKKKGGGKSPYHYHQFRNYFISNMNLVIHPEIVKVLISGHSNNIDAVYRKYSQRQVLDAYKAGSDAVTVETDPSLKKKYLETMDRVGDLESRQLNQSDNMSVILKTLGDYQKETEKLKSVIERMQKDHDLLIAQLEKKNILPIARVIKIRDKKTGKTSIIEQQFKIE